MIKYNIHHILVIKDGKLTGVITNHDMMMLQGTSPLSLTKDIESQQTIEGLIPVSKKINGIVGLLLKEGAKASNITKVITEINDRLVRKVLEFAERKHGKPPVALLLDRLWERGPQGADLQDRSGQRYHLRRSGERRRGGGREKIFLRLCRVCAGQPAPVRIPALPGKLYGEQSPMVPAAQGLEKIFFHLDLDAYARKPC